MRAYFRFALLCAVLLSAAGLAAQGLAGNEQRVRALDDPLVADIEDLLMESGSLFLSYAAPYSDGELRAALDRVDPESLSAAGRAKYDAALAALRPDPGYRSGALAAKAGLRAALDANWRSNEALPWVQGYRERPSFLDTWAEIWTGANAYGYVEASLKRDYYAVQAKLSDLPFPNVSSIPLDFANVDGSFPFRAFGAVGGDFWSFRLGRDKLSIGSMGEDNLIVSSGTEWYDYARLTLFFRDFQYSSYVVQLQPQRNLYLHRLDFLFFDRLSFGLTEATLVGDAPLELRFLNPLIIFHGFQAWNDESVLVAGTPTSGVGSTLGLELDYAALPGLNLVLQYQFNAGRDPIKTVLWPAATSEIPNSAAYLAGAKLRAPFMGGYLRGELLGVYSEPFDMLLSSDRISYIYYRPSNSNLSGDPIERWIGFPEGPDAILVSGRLGFEAASRTSASLSASYRWKGENELGKLYPYARTAANAALRTPTGIVEGRFRIGAECSVPVMPRFKASAAAYYTRRVNADNAPGIGDDAVELMAGLGFSL